MQERMNIIQAITARVEIALVPVVVTRVIRVGALVMIVTVIQKIAKASKNLARNLRICNLRPKKVVNLCIREIWLLGHHCCLIAVILLVII